MIKKMRLRTWTIFSVILCALSHIAEAAEADVYTEDQFVTAALEASLSLGSAKNQLAAAKLDEKQVDLQTAPQLSSSLSSINDRNPSTMATPSYSSLTGTEYNLGVTQQFRYGTKAKLGFSLKNNTLRDVTIAPSPSSSDLDTSVFAPTIEVSQSLLQNGFGRALSLQRELLARQSDGQSSELLIRQQAVTLEAKVAYYRLAFMRDRVATARSTLDTAQKILQFVTAKVHNNLYEKSDLLQAEALVESRKIELKSAIMEQTSAEIAFNSLRGNTSTQVNERIFSFRTLESNKTFPDLSVGTRPELKRLRDTLAASELSIALEEDKTKPSLDLFGSYTLTGNRENPAEAVKNVADPYQPTSVIGLRLNMTLDRDLLKSQVEAQKVRKMALQKQYEDTVRSLNKDLQGLLTKRQSAAELYEISRGLEDIQRNKLENEQYNYRNGRSTTYQLLMFTQDLAQSELNRLESAYQIAILDIQLQLFKEKKI